MISPKNGASIEVTYFPQNGANKEAIFFFQEKRNTDMIFSLKKKFGVSKRGGKKNKWRNNFVFK